jgi:hypothetical protein
MHIGALALADADGIAGGAELPGVVRVSQQHGRRAPGNLVLPILLPTLPFCLNPERKKWLDNRGSSHAGGGTRTPDTRIMIPLL